MIMAGCANRTLGFWDVSAKDFNPSLNLVHFLSDAGFADINEDDYCSKKKKELLFAALLRSIFGVNQHLPRPIAGFGEVGLLG